MQQLLAMSLRALNLGSKFFVFFLLAKYAEPEQLSLFGVYWTSVVAISALMGLELYGHTIRTFIPEEDVDKRGNIIGRHFGSLILMNLFLMPVVLLSIYLSLERLAPLLFILGVHLASELLSQDNSRLLIGLGHPLKAIFLNTVRGALWSGIAVGYIVIEGAALEINYLIYIWVGFSFVSLLLSFVFIGQSLKYIPLPKFDPRWLISALKISSVLILCALFFRALVSGDKYLAENLFGANISAYYIFYATIAFAVSGLIESGVSAWYYPKLISAIKSQSGPRFLEVRRKFFIRNLVSSIVLSAMVLLASYLAARYYLDEPYLENYPLLVICMLGVAFYSCSMPDHYSIYGLEKDKIILLINCSASILFFAGAFVLKSEFGIHGLALAFLGGLLYIALARRVAARYFLNNLLFQK